GDLPVVPIDSARLSQVVLNLVQNALQAMESGGELWIQTRRRHGRAGPVIEIVVRDTGPGIAEDDHEKLFVPFYTTKSTGTGLGLAISQRIVQAHGGEIEVLSPSGQGATFIVRLPVPDALDEGREAAK